MDMNETQNKQWTWKDEAGLYFGLAKDVASWILYFLLVLIVPAALLFGLVKFIKFAWSY